VTASVQMLLIVFEKHNEELKLRIGKDISASGVEKYERTRTRLCEFMKQQYNIDDIPLKEINFNFHLSQSGISLVCKSINFWVWS